MKGETKTIKLVKLYAALERSQEPLIGKAMIPKAWVKKGSLNQSLQICKYVVHRLTCIPDPSDWLLVCQHRAIVINGLRRKNK